MGWEEKIPRNRDGAQVIVGRVHDAVIVVEHANHHRRQFDAARACGHTAETRHDEALSPYRVKIIFGNASGAPRHKVSVVGRCRQQAEQHGVRIRCAEHAVLVLETRRRGNGDGEAIRVRPHLVSDKRCEQCGDGRSVRLAFFNIRYSSPRLTLKTRCPFAFFPVRGACSSCHSPPSAASALMANRY